MLTESMRTIASRNLTGTIAPLQQLSASSEYRMAPAAGPRAVTDKRLPPASGGGAGSHGCSDGDGCSDGEEHSG